MVSILSWPPDTLLMRSAKYRKFSYSVRLAGHVACIFRTVCACAAAENAAMAANATAERTNCLMTSSSSIRGFLRRKQGTRLFLLGQRNEKGRRSAPFRCVKDGYLAFASFPFDAAAGFSGK